jgi:RimJ/RimL family protein N-acetyltransferase
MTGDYWAGREIVFGMFSEKGEVLGGLGLHPRTALNPRALEVGYWCHTGHAGKGWTTLAVRMAAVVVFECFECDRFQVSHDETNLPSQRVVEKCGFTYEGTARKIVAAADSELYAGGYRGVGRQRVYALTNDDVAQLAWFEPMRAKLTLVDALGGERHLIQRTV